MRIIFWLFILISLSLTMGATPAAAQVYPKYRDCTDSPTCISKKCEWDDFQDGYVCIEKKPPPPREKPAEGTLQNPVADILNPASGADATVVLSNLIQTLVTLLIIGAAVVFFFMFLIGAIKWITSGGDKAQIESARGAIMNAVVGLVIALSLFAIIKLIEGVFGIELLQLDIGALRIR